jgi:hypothetical protein
MSWSAVSGIPAAAVVITAVDVPCVSAMDGVSAVVGVLCCCLHPLLLLASPAVLAVSYAVVGLAVNVFLSLLFLSYG